MNLQKWIISLFSFLKKTNFGKEVEETEEIHVLIVQRVVQADSIAIPEKL